MEDVSGAGNGLCGNLPVRNAALYNLHPVRFFDEPVVAKCPDPVAGVFRVSQETLNEGGADLSGCPGYQYQPVFAF